MLENFRTQKIIWDRANKKIFEKIEANSGDSNGRKLVVQVINQGVTENLLGTTLSLGWKSRKGAKGLDTFNVVDASKGIFEIYYTTEMLSNIGNIEASFILIDSTSRIESSTFTISVRPSTVDDESVESENSFTALTEALIDVSNLEQNYAPRLNEVTAQLAQTVNKTPHYESVKLFDINEPPISGFVYNAFASGAVIDGKEIHVFRSAPEHVTRPDLGFGVLLAVIRELDGSFTQKVLDLNYNGKEYRDPNLSVSKNGQNLLLTAVSYDGVSYSNWLWVLRSDLSVVTTVNHPSMDGYFGWGNAIYSPRGILMKTAYRVDDTGGVYLFYGNSAEQMIEVFPPSENKPTEATIAQWGDKLICVARQDKSGTGLYRETLDLEGLTGWGEIKLIQHVVHAPVLPVYIPSNEPLILSYSGHSSDGRRSVRAVATYDGVTWSMPKIIAQNDGNGGYNSFVKTEFGYCMIYYDDTGLGTSLYYKNVDSNKMLNDLAYLSVTSKPKETGIAYKNGSGIVENKEIIKFVSGDFEVSGDGTSSVDFTIDISSFGIDSSKKEGVILLGVYPIGLATIFSVRISRVTASIIEGKLKTDDDSIFSTNVHLLYSLVHTK